jgi:hypothetical protein
MGSGPPERQAKIREVIMGANFKILTHRNSDSVHFKLVGDFDGRSAHQLVELLKRNYERVSTIFIHTSCLREIIPFGLDLLRQNLEPFMNGSTRLVFTGDHAIRLGVC